MATNIETILLHSKAVSSAQCFSIQIDRNESIHNKIHATLLKNAANSEEKNTLLSNPLYIRHGDFEINDFHYLKHPCAQMRAPVTLNSLGVKNGEVISIIAESNPDNIYDHYHTLRFYTETSKDVDKFRSWLSKQNSDGVKAEIWHHPMPGKFADVKILRTVKPTFEETGLRVEAHAGSIKEKVFQSKQACGADFFHSFHDYNEIIDHIHCSLGKAAQNPEIKVNIFGIGHSGQNRPIYGVTVSRPNPNLKVRPRIVITSGIHGREWSSVSSNLYLLDQVLSMKDKKMVQLLDYCELILIPVLNPDGYEKSWEPGNRLWRKNANCVDINRNFGVGFSSSSFLSYISDDYTGPEAYSETETKAISNFFKLLCESAPTLSTLDLHCYSSVVCFPYAYTKSKPTNFETMFGCAKMMCDVISKKSAFSYAYGQIASKIYTCGGTMLDFVFDSNLSEFAFVNELPGDDFITHPADIVPIAEAAYLGVRTMMRVSLQKGENGPVLFETLKKAMPLAVASSAPPLPSGEFRATPAPPAERRHSPLGIENRGNTCYVSSVLQCFGAMRALNESLAAAGRVERPFLTGFRKVNAAFWAPEREKKAGLAETKDALDGMLSEICKNGEFHKSEMEDCSKFALFCADELIKNNINLFSGSITNFIGNHRNNENFFYIALPLTSNDLETCLEDYFSTECLPNGAEKSLRITKFPEILMVSLNKNPARGMKAVKIPKTIDMAPHSLSADGQELYRLNGLVDFHGASPTGGHFTAKVRSDKNQWFEANDKDVFFDGQATAHSSIDDRSACLLFFERVGKDAKRGVLRY